MNKDEKELTKEEIIEILTNNLSEHNVWIEAGFKSFKKLNENTQKEISFEKYFDFIIKKNYEYQNSDDEIYHCKNCENEMKVFGDFCETCEEIKNKSEIQLLTKIRKELKEDVSFKIKVSSERKARDFVKDKYYDLILENQKIEFKILDLGVEVYSINQMNKSDKNKTLNFN